jgi:hypothetical protein
VVTRRQAVEAALAAWREADRKLAAGANGDTDRIKADIERHKREFQRLSTEHMIERLDALADAEQRRRSATPSTKPFHDAAQDEKRIAAEIWEHARASDEDVPGAEDH